MGDFLALAFSFPTVLLSVLLLAVVGYWLLVVAGLTNSTLDNLGVDGLAAGLGLGGVPVTVVVSVLVTLGWYATLLGSSLLDQLDLPAGLLAAAGIGVVAIALVLAWAVTWLTVLGLRRVVRRGTPELDRPDFVGRVCVIRTGRVDHEFGQAEVTADDGSSAIVQVRQNGDDPLSSGDTAIIFDYDRDREFFWVAPYAAELDPNRPLD